MSRRVIFSVLLMSALLALYLWAALFQGIVMIATGIPVAIAMGIALIVLPLVGGWALFRELQFGFQSQKLIKILAEEGPLPGDSLDHTPSGKPVRQQADEQFPVFAQAAQQQPENWRAWMELGIAYDNAGDRKRARHAVRTAIQLHKKVSVHE